jgi:hypothetical protein
MNQPPHNVETICYGYTDPKVRELETKLAAAEAKLAADEKERSELVEFLKHNFPELCSVEAWPVERAKFKIRSLFRELSEAKAHSRRLPQGGDCVFRHGRFRHGTV